MATPNQLLYPWTFGRTAVPKPWAGGRLSSLFPSLAATLRPSTGETIEVAGYAASSTPIEHGAAIGMTLAEVIEAVGWEAVVGRAEVDFPVVLKFLDTAAPLSVQVHPCDGWLGIGSRGKNECWLVLEADTDAHVWQGVLPGVSPQDFWRHATEGKIEHVMHRRPLVRGDFIDNPAGMVHAIGPGVVLAELQEACPVTWRIWDWGGRTEPGWEDTAESATPRPLHLREARAAAKLSLPLPPILNVLRGELSKGSGGEVWMRRGRDFSWASLRWNGLLKRDRGPAAARLYTSVGGVAELKVDGFDAVTLEPGASVLIPAALGDVTLDGDTAWVLEAVVGQE